MPAFVEDPWSRIVAVHWKDDDDGGGPGPGEPGPCGQVLLQGLVGLGDTTNNTGIHLLDGAGVWFVSRNTAAHPLDKPFTMTNALIIYGYVPENTYVWSAPGSWTIAFGTPLRPSDQFRLNVYRNLNTQAFANLGRDDYMAVPPDQTTPLAGALTVEAQRADETYQPVYTVDYYDALAVQWNRYAFPGGGIQAHCAEETPGGLPPQPPDYVIIRTGEAPGSTNAPLKPPPLPTSTR